MGNKVFVVGVGMTKFEKPGSREWDYPDMAEEAGKKALADAGIAYDEIEQAVAGYCYGDSTCGERAVYTLGLTGIPIYNVNNNCSTGSTALFMAKQFVQGGLADCVLAHRLREDGEGLARHQVHRPHQSDGQAREADDRDARLRQGARRRRSSSATPAASTWSATAPSPSTSRRSAGRTTSTR